MAVFCTIHDRCFSLVSAAVSLRLPADAANATQGLNPYCVASLENVQVVVKDANGAFLALCDGQQTDTGLGSGCQWSPPGEDGQQEGREVRFVGIGMRQREMRVQFQALENGVVATASNIFNLTGLSSAQPNPADSFENTIAKHVVGVSVLGIHFAGGIKADRAGAVAPCPALLLGDSRRQAAGWGPGGPAALPDR
eukprot:scaffold276240_cov44-Prasinocladus_malaysianus.AAC.3